jgi:hypothetical protein
MDMDRKEYAPAPIDTTDVTLPPDILELAELLAKNTHDVYVQGRLAEGWTYGETRDDQKKTNPTLIPYEDLPGSEQEYDRRTSIETLKVILKLGYTLKKE